MTEESTKSAPTVEEAVDAALEELGVQADGAEFEVLEQPGRNGGQATVRAWVQPGYLESPEEATGEGEEPRPAGLPVDGGRERRARDGGASDRVISWLSIALEHEDRQPQSVQARDSRARRLPDRFTVGEDRCQRTIYREEDGRLPKCRQPFGSVTER